jgi:hypothetical protein
MEHGMVIVYYNPAYLTEDVKKSLEVFVEANRNNVGAIAVPSADYEYPFILTAWGKMLELNTYDTKVVQAFLAEYLGRGPEIKVR